METCWQDSIWEGAMPLLALCKYQKVTKLTLELTTHYICFFSIGLIVGFVFSSILMSVVGSAVNTVIVCYAESPAEFQANHPQLSAEMRAAWILAWPGLIN
jgi:large-conductance mechanosensitive channel